MDYSTNGMETGTLNTIINQIEPKENYLLSSKTVIPEDEINEMKYNTQVTYPANKQAKEEVACVGLSSLGNMWACIILLKDSSKDA
ncbi:hypothetical protein TNCV_1861931 [Trichonephila clavipes]|nr:hypothetical protein TNCV_1861931 [Trichonephila clavipes]